MKKLKKGFTLIELLIVIIILAILIAIVVGVSFQSNRNKAYDIDKKGDVASYQKKLEEYFVDNNSYPATLASLEPDYFPQGGSPTNPAGDQYQYTPSPEGCQGTTASPCTGYQLQVRLSNQRDQSTNTVDDNGTRVYRIVSSQ